MKGQDVMLRKNPPHPGPIVRDECLEPFGLTVTGAARGKAGISPEVAVRLAKAFAGTAEAWLRMQAEVAA